jgi:thiamine biosynthesis lipoprotein ApbE
MWERIVVLRRPSSSVRWARESRLAAVLLSNDSSIFEFAILEMQANFHNVTVTAFHHSSAVAQSLSTALFASASRRL